MVEHARGVCRGVGGWGDRGESDLTEVNSRQLSVTNSKRNYLDTPVPSNSARVEGK
jgi:hypothetical protein